MNEQELKKNKLDLEYNHELQKANVFLILITTGVLGFIGTFVWIRKYLLFGFVLAGLIMIIGISLYLKTVSKMKQILFQIENI